MPIVTVYFKDNLGCSATEAFSLYMSKHAIKHVIIIFHAENLLLLVITEIQILSNSI